jgi:hypothetical protein
MLQILPAAFIRWTTGRETLGKLGATESHWLRIQLAMKVIDSRGREEITKLNSELTCTGKRNEEGWEGSRIETKAAAPHREEASFTTRLAPPQKEMVTSMDPTSRRVGVIVKAKEPTIGKVLNPLKEATTIHNQAIEDKEKIQEIDMIQDLGKGRDQWLTQTPKQRGRSIISMIFRYHLLRFRKVAQANLKEVEVEASSREGKEASQCEGTEASLKEGKEANLMEGKEASSGEVKEAIAMEGEEASIVMLEASPDGGKEASPREGEEVLLEMEEVLLEMEEILLEVEEALF